MAFPIRNIHRPYNVSAGTAVRHCVHFLIPILWRDLAEEHDVCIRWCYCAIHHSCYHCDTTLDLHTSLADWKHTTDPASCNAVSYFLVEEIHSSYMMSRLSVVICSVWRPQTRHVGWVFRQVQRLWPCLDVNKPPCWKALVIVYIHTRNVSILQFPRTKMTSKPAVSDLLVCTSIIAVYTALAYSVYLHKCVPTYNIMHTYIKIATIFIFMITWQMWIDFTSSFTLVFRD